LDIQPIITDDDYRQKLREIDRLWGARRGTADAAKLDLLTTLVERYEEELYPIPKADPIGVIRFVMEQNDYTQRDLADVLGSRSRASELLNGKRELTLDQIRRLSRAWHIPAGALIGELEDA